MIAFTFSLPSGGAGVGFSQKTPPHLPFLSGMLINTGEAEGEVLLKHLP
jgi:hypothetical protein